MAQNEPQRKQTPPGPSPNSPSVSGKFIRLPNRIEKIDSVASIESNRNFFLPELECSTSIAAHSVGFLEVLKVSLLGSDDVCRRFARSVQVENVAVDVEECLAPFEL